MSDVLREGRALTRVNLWRIFAVSAFVAWLATRGGAPATATWLRLALIAVACLAVYRGARWALWLLGFLTVFAGAMMMVIAVSRPDLRWTDRVLFGVPGALQVLAFVILARAPEVRAFMAAQRAATGPEPRNGAAGD